MCICVMYILDRFLLTFWYDFPPIYDDSLNIKFLKVLKYAPWLFTLSYELILMILNKTGAGTTYKLKVID